MERARQVALTVASALLLQGCTLGRALVHNFPGLDDQDVFASRTIERAPQASRLRALSRTPGFLTALRVPDGSGGDARLDDFLDDTRTVAFVVLHEDRIVYERYAEGHTAASLLNSFSIAKAIVGTLAGIALAEGRIASLDDPVARYRPEFAGTPYGSVTLRQLLTMTSGVLESPGLLPGNARYYYGDDLHALAAREAVRATSAQRWRYSNADVQVLGFVIEAAVGQPLSRYLAERLWAPLGMESPALWSLDREGGTEKAFCCVRARARDFARFGALYLNEGRWRGHVVVPAAWAARQVLAGEATATDDVHRHLWWTPPGGVGDFYAYGHDGQYVYVHPAARTVIVRFSTGSRRDPVPAFRAIARELQSPRRLAEIERLAAEPLALGPAVHGHR